MPYDNLEKKGEKVKKREDENNPLILPNIFFQKVIKQKKKRQKKRIITKTCQLLLQLSSPLNLDKLCKRNDYNIILYKKSQFYPNLSSSKFINKTKKFTL